MPDSTGRLPEAEGADEEVLGMPAVEEEGGSEEVLAMLGDPADEEPGAEDGREVLVMSEDQGVLRIPLQGLRTAIAVIEQDQPPEK